MSTRGLLGLIHTCPHTQTSPSDEMGDAICADCGGTVRVTLTPALLADTLDTLIRDRGPYGRHSKRCVRLPAREWVCSDDCRLR